MYTLDDVRAIVTKLDRDAVNPYFIDNASARKCLYTGRDDPTKHCIAGQILVELDVDCPDTNVLKPFTKLEQAELFDASACSYIQSLQFAADRAATKWGEAIDDLEGSLAYHD